MEPQDMGLCLTMAPWVILTWGAHISNPRGLGKPPTMCQRHRGAGYSPPNNDPHAQDVLGLGRHRPGGQRCGTMNKQNRERVKTLVGQMNDIKQELDEIMTETAKAGEVKQTDKLGDVVTSLDIAETETKELLAIPDL